MSRRATLSAYSQRLTPVEVARLWFRRGADYSGQIHADHPDFPKAAQDGLFLLSHVEGWFARFHGTGQPLRETPEGEEEEAMRVARGRR